MNLEDLNDYVNEQFNQLQTYFNNNLLQLYGINTELQAISFLANDDVDQEFAKYLYETFELDEDSVGTIIETFYNSTVDDIRKMEDEYNFETVLLISKNKKDFKKLQDIVDVFYHDESFPYRNLLEKHCSHQISQKRINDLHEENA